MELDLFSHVALFKQRYFHIEIRDDSHFGEICDFLTKSGKFRTFKYVDTEIFTNHFREPGEISRTFEFAEPLKVLNLNLIKTSLSGEIRFFLTIYRAGFVVLSLLHSIVPTKMDSTPIGKNLTSKRPVDFSDMIFLIKEKNPENNIDLVYELQLVEQTRKMKGPELIEYLLRELQIYEKAVKKQPSTNSYIIHFWSPHLSASFHKILKEKYRDLFYVFIAPQVSKPTETKKEIVKKLEDHIFWSSKTRGFLFREKAIIIVSPVLQEPNRVFKTQLPWLFQLALTQNFMLQFYSWRVREFVSKLEKTVSSKPSDLMSQFIGLSSSFSIGLESSVLG